MSSISFTLVQTALHWEDKAANLQMLSQKIAAISGKKQVVILPEMFSTGFSMKPQLQAETMDGPTVQWMKKTAAENKIILTGSVIIEEDGRHYNRFVWMLPNGRHGHYNKRHLFAFAGEDKHYTAGTQRMIAQVNGWRVNLQVCYDLRFPVWARQAPGTEPFEYDILVYVANWPAARSHAWKTLLQARAIENQCYVIGVNRVGEDGAGHAHSGDSMVVSPLGEVLYTHQNEEAVHTITLHKKELDSVREKFQFWRDADVFSVIPFSNK